MEKFWQLVNRAKSLWQKQPKAFIASGFVLAFLIFFIVNFFEPEKVTKSKNEKLKASLPPLESVQHAIDPRELWVDEMSKKMDEIKEEMLKISNKQKEDHFNELQSLKEELKSSKEQERPMGHLKDYELEFNQSLPEAPAPVKDASPKLGYIGVPKNLKKNPKNFVAAGAFARAVLLTGVVADTGVSSASEPQPILLRLVDNSIFSKQVRTQVKEAIIIGSCFGHISSERANCRLESISLVSKDGNIISRSLEGWIIGEDGRPGIAGKVVDTSTKVVRAALLNGILGGMASFMQNQATNEQYPLSIVVGNPKSTALKGEKALKASAASGVGNALEKLADYAIKRAEQINPVIVVGSGRVVDVVFRRGFHLKDEDEEPANSQYSNSQHSNSQYSNIQNAKSQIGRSLENFARPVANLQDLKGMLTPTKEQGW
jgi:conjugal transfer pilus assembly protein TraB